MGWLRKMLGTPVDYRGLFSTKLRIKEAIETEYQLYIEWLYQRYKQLGYYGAPLKSEAIELFLSLSKEEVEKVKYFDEPYFMVSLRGKGVKDNSLDNTIKLYVLLKEVISDISEPIYTLLYNWDILVEKVEIVTYHNHYLILLKDGTYMTIGCRRGDLKLEDKDLFSTEIERKAIAFKSSRCIVDNRQYELKKERDKLADTINNLITKEKDNV